jgi:predicted RNase H-like HicB family nuclease
MATAGYVYWQDGAQWLGYFEEYPDYQTQGESLEELQEVLRDLFGDLTSGTTALVGQAILPAAAF